MPEAAPSAPAEFFGEALVYGLHQRHRVIQLIEALAEIPCCPRRIFRINAGNGKADRCARWLGVDDHISKQIYYVRIHHWGKVPVIGWSMDPAVYGRHLRRQAERARLDYESALRLKPMVVKYDAQRQVDLLQKRSIARHNNTL